MGDVTSAGSGGSVSTMRSSIDPSKELCIDPICCVASYKYAEGIGGKKSKSGKKDTGSKIGVNAAASNHSSSEKDDKSWESSSETGGGGGGEGGDGSGGDGLGDMGDSGMM